MKLFKDLSKEEQKEYRQWARDNWKPGNDIKTIWHPIIVDECNKMNLEKTVEI